MKVIIQNTIEQYAKLFSMDNSSIYTNVSRNNTKATTDYIFESKYSALFT